MNINQEHNQILDLIPTPMLIEDLSGLKQLFDTWRQSGIKNLRAFLLEDETRFLQCLSNIKIIHTNQKALLLFEALSLQNLIENINVIFQAESRASCLQSLELLWQGETQFTHSIVNYTVHNKLLNLKLNFVLPPNAKESWEMALLTVEDISEYTLAQKKEHQQRLLAEGMFKYSPASLWVEDFSRIKLKLDYLREIGIDDFRTFLDVHPEFILECMKDITVLDVNQATLDLFLAPNKETLIQNLTIVFSGQMQNTFKEQLIDLWNGNILQRREAINYALDGSIRHVLLQFSVFPGYEHDWSLVQLSLTDITARKKAESYLEYLGKHDVLTKLYNRSFFIEEVHRLERSSIRPVSCIYLDMNGLKQINDSLGHDSGDSVLGRLGDILNQIVLAPHTVSRIGGDEMVILMPGANAQIVEATILSIHEFLHIDNQFYSSLPISVSIGSATSVENEQIEKMINRADQAMYIEKKYYYHEQKLKHKS